MNKERMQTLCAAAAPAKSAHVLLSRAVLAELLNERDQASQAMQLALATFKDYFPMQHGSEQIGMAWGALEASLKQLGIDTKYLEEVQALGWSSIEQYESAMQEKEARRIFEASILAETRAHNLAHP